MKTLEGTATTAASPAAVWAQLDDVSRWPRWGRWTEGLVEGGGPQQVGAVRVLVQKPFRVRERITEWVPNERMAYELLEGMKVRGYRSVVTLEPADGGGTLVRWRSTYESASPVTAVLLRLAVRDTPKRLAKAAAAG